MENKVSFTRIENDVNGNPRYVINFQELVNDNDRETTKPDPSLDKLFAVALKKARTIGGRTYRAKWYGGGIVFQSYNINELEKQILELRNK